jgi:hypothetical protein
MEEAMSFRLRRSLMFTWLLMVAFSVLVSIQMFGQETTGGLQGTVKDPSGAVVPNAQIVATSNILVGNKTANSDGSGYYRFANLPPGSYVVTVTAKGFRTSKREGLVIEVGHLPTVDLTLEIGGTETVVEVSGATPAIDTSQNITQTNITEDVVQDVPHGRSFQSVIQFAPMARNEPLAGSLGSPEMSAGNGTGGQSAGSGGNGGQYGFSVGGGADSENGYLVEGQETADSIGGFSHSNVPFDFIQEVQVKTSGMEAEHGGALGGVVNVIMKKGSNAYHGSAFMSFEDGGWDGSPGAYSYYDPAYTTTINPAGNAYVDPAYENYQPKRDRTRDNMPGFTFGGPILKDKLFFFLGFNPEFTQKERIVDMGSNAPLPFSRNSQTYYTTSRVDAALNQKVRVFGSWLYQYERETGAALPLADSTTGFPNPNASSPPFVFGHNLGFGAPNVTTNVGMDYTVTPRLVATVRWGYNFQNYHDFGYPTNGNINQFLTSGAGALDNSGVAIPASSPLSQTAGYINVAANQNDTTFDASHRNQIDGDMAWFKSGWAGTHNLKFGYQLMRLSNAVLQHWNEPFINVSPGAGNDYPVAGPVGQANCLTPGLTVNYNSQGQVVSCAGRYGFASIQDYGSTGQATSMNHAFFVQDSWTIGRGVTINAGVRLEHEYLPAEDQPQGGISRPIQFGWGSKITPRIGAAWDVFRDGRMKVFGSYGAFTDVMKLNLAISSFGGQYWQNCFYAMNTDQISTLAPVFNSANRFCVGPNSASQANFSGGVGATPPGFVFLENQNYRTFPTSCATCTATEEGVAPGLNPYRQHETVFGVDYQLRKNLAFEARWDRRRLDDVIEDSAIFNPNIGETFVIVNPGKGVNQTFNGFWNFLYGSPSGCGTAGNVACPPNNIPGARSYDGVELRLTKTNSQHWFGMFSYSYSNLRGNYTGLTSTDIGDGGGGRNAPNNSRSFDEPFFSWNAQGGSSSGLLPTDRPNTFKGYAYYELGWLKKFTTDFGLFQYMYQGTPQTSIMDAGYSFAPTAGAFPTDILDRGKWANITQNPSTGAISVGPTQTYRTPWYNQSDFNLQQNYKLGEEKVLSFSATISNLFNERSVTAYYPFVDTQNFGQYLAPGGLNITAGAPAYAALLAPYNWQALLRSTGGNTPGNSGIETINSQYGKPFIYQLSRNLRMGVKFTF